MKKVNLTREFLQRERKKLIKQIRHLSGQLLKIEELRSSLNVNSQSDLVFIEIDELYPKVKHNYKLNKK